MAKPAHSSGTGLRAGRTCALVEFFREIKPVATIVEVSNLIKPEILVEIEFSEIKG